MMDYTNDLTFWLYILSILAALWGFCLFSWWGYKTWKVTKERPTSVFICLWLLFLGEMMDSSISAYMRAHAVSYGYSQAYSFFRSWAWTIRVMPILTAMIAIDYIMTYRILFHKTLFKSNGHKHIEVSGGTMEYAHLKDADPIEIKMVGKKIEDAVLRGAKIEIAVILDAMIKDIEE